MIRLALALTVVLAAAPAFAQSIDLPVVVLDRAGLNATVLNAAKAEAARLFADSGVTLTWPDQPPPAGRYVRLIFDKVPGFKERQLTDGTLGLAVRPTVAYVFTADADRLSRQFGTPGPTILGMAIAHELAHLLLPPGHAKAGLMKAKWNAADFTAATMGNLKFDPASSLAIRLAIMAPRPPNPQSPIPSSAVGARW